MKSGLKNLPQHGRYSSAPTAVVGKASIASDDIKKLQQDIVLISARLSQGNPASSTVVGDLRSAVADARSSVDSLPPATKAELMDEVLRKVAELDRGILKRTEPALTEGQRPRRNSNTMELFSIPTHFQIIDRLVDLHTQSRRPVIVHQHSAPSADTSPKSSKNADQDAQMAALKARHDAAISAMTATLRSMETQLTAAENNSRDSQNELKILKAEKSKLMDENARILTDNLKLKEDVEILKTSVSQVVAVDSQEFNDNMAMFHGIEERLECAVSNEINICNAMLKLANNIQDEKSLGGVENYFSDGGQVIVLCSDGIGYHHTNLSYLRSHAM